MWNQSPQNQQQYLQDGRKFSNLQIDFLLARFSRNGIPVVGIKDGMIRINSTHKSKCNKFLESPEFAKLEEDSKKQESSFGSAFLPPSEKERLAKQKKLHQIEGIISGLEGLRDAVIFHDQARPENFSRRNIHTANITLWAQQGHLVGPLQAASARQILSSSIVGLRESDILVVDGDTGVTFPYREDSANDRFETESQRDLEATRRQIESQTRKLVSRFGDSDIVVRMDLEKRAIRIMPDPRANAKNIDRTKQESKVVPNGTGSIKTRNSVKTKQNVPEVQTRTIVIKRLLGIDVLLKRESVTRHIRQQHGTEHEVSEEQFSRGTAQLRNEITKELLSWLKGQNGIDVGSDLISVMIAPEQESEMLSESEANQNPIISGMTPMIASIGIIAAGLLFTLSWKSRKNNIASNEALSGGGRSFVSRNQTNAGRELAEEANEVVHSTPANSARAFQNLVTGDTK